MKIKGFIRVITVALILICAFYLSFTFVASSYENDAEAKANAAAAKVAKTAPAAADSVYEATFNDYINSFGDKKVYLGYTVQEVREKQLGLGLDLKGGMNVMLQISVPDILKSLAGNNKDNPAFKAAIAKLSGQSAGQKDYVESFVEEFKAQNGNLVNVFRDGLKKKGIYNAKDDDVVKFLKDEVASGIDKQYVILRNRIYTLNVQSPNVQKLEGSGRILIELPGVKDPTRVKKLIKQAANLEFYETFTYNDVANSLNQVYAAYDASLKTDSIDPITKQPRKHMGEMLNNGGMNAGSCAVGIAEGPDTALVSAAIAKYRNGILDPNLKLCWTFKEERTATGKDGKQIKYYTLVALKTNKGQARMGGEGVTEAKAEFEQLKGEVVTMKMDDNGARQWSRLTGDNIGKQVAVVLDDMVYSYPNVNSKIDGGNTEISGNFSVEEATDLANILMSGRMDASVEIISDSVIGPSLGQESINNGMISFVVALILLMIMMVSVYGIKAGSIANLGLILNLFFTIGILASFKSVLTLPGIAGIVLALGMAVDANVLIFERCKEELRNGKNLKAAVKDGYSNAFSAIFDGNLTSIITGVILWATCNGGPIQGFAVTLIWGILSSFFTAVFATRLVLERFLYSGAFGFDTMTFCTGWSKNLMQGTHFDFIGKRKKTATFVAVVVVAFVALFATLGLSMGIDFSGGRNYVVKFDKTVNAQDLQDKIQAQFGDSKVSVITIGTSGNQVRVSTNYKIDQNSQAIDGEITKKIYTAVKNELGKNVTEKDFGVENSNIGIIQSDIVGPSIANDMTRDAILAVIFSLIAMALYILLRFRNVAFSLGAVTAVALTSFIVIGFYTFHGMLGFSMEVDQTFIAAILTVIGYQINDTVVVFDRVREYRRLFPKQDSTLTFNNALNSTLSRTMMTSISTLLVLVVIFILGGESIRSFNFAMILGVIFGTCCSLFVAAPTAWVLVNRKKK